jgi:hypothetical protein
MTELESSLTLRHFQDWTSGMHERVNAARGNRDHLSNCVHGVCGELGEMFEPHADLLIEAGDVLSYIAMACSVMGIKIEYWLREEALDDHVRAAQYFRDFFPNQHVRFELDTCKLALRLAELAKKEIYQGKITPIEDWEYLLSSIFLRVNTWCGMCGFALRHVLEANIKKLTARYSEVALS